MSVRINGVNYNTTIRTTGSGLGTAASDQSANLAADGIGTWHMADNPNIYEPQRSNNFEFIVTGLTNLYKPGTDTLITNGQNILRVSITQAPIPSFSQSPLEVRRGNTAIRYAGTIAFDSPGQFTFNDYIGVDSYNVLQAWQYLSGNPQTEKVGLAADYKKECYLIKYSPDYQPVFRWKFRGCWISQLTESEMNNENNAGLVKITARIEYDRAEPDNNI